MMSIIVTLLDMVIVILISLVPMAPLLSLPGPEN